MKKLFVVAAFILCVVQGAVATENPVLAGSYEKVGRTCCEQYFERRDFEIAELDRKLFLSKLDPEKDLLLQINAKVEATRNKASKIKDGIKKRKVPVDDNLLIDLNLALAPDFRVSQLVHTLESRKIVNDIANRIVPLYSNFRVMYDSLQNIKEATRLVVDTITKIMDDARKVDIIETVILGECPLLYEPTEAEKESQKLMIR
jgi:hypothetical protein